ncbi:aminotransferase class I/II-fold pyridoxal phosphate-dependent enzyme [Bradyrhizobium sp. Ghvi]|uniref:aminotransferase class I/II-fold pyridoxal phosphate-dependent enzyme n=1 Tax=Bradyrhizobium sp. Ghvi TaxID=1855319 RepID=UPI001FCD8E79|nr:aminotransferase class I/II-fold pyridoxal phosphate-dependent enzyme [Bradyrhizobium sp. Ghvi]
MKRTIWDASCCASAQQSRTKNDRVIAVSIILSKAAIGSFGRSLSDRSPRKRSFELVEYGVLSLVSERLKVARPSQTEVMTARAAELRDHGADVISLSQAGPDLGTPPALCEAGIRAIRDGQTKYPAVAGIKPLRQAIRESLYRDHGLDYGIDQITVGCGAKQVVFNALFASLDPGDEAVIPTPCWVSCPDMVWASSLEPSALCGLPDMRLISMTQHLDTLRAMAGCMRLPIVGDIRAMAMRSMSSMLSRNRC